MEKPEKKGSKKSEKKKFASKKDDKKKSSTPSDDSDEVARLRVRVLQLDEHLKESMQINDLLLDREEQSKKRISELEQMVLVLHEELKKIAAKK